MALAFRLKVYTEIISGMFSTIRTALGADVDLNPGSYIRSILEAAALQDAEQYAQIAKLLDLFSIDNTRGDDLDRRGQDFGVLFQTDLRRISPRQSTVKITVRDSNYPESSIVSATDASVAAGATTFNVQASTGILFPSSCLVVMERGTLREEQFFTSRVGDIFTLLGGDVVDFGHLSSSSVDLLAIGSVLAGGTIIGATVFTVAAGTGAAFPAAGSVVIGRETANRELLAFTRVGDVFTTPPAAFAHSLNDSFVLSTVGSDRTTGAGSEVFVPETAVSPEVAFTLDVSVTLLDGDFQSPLVQATSKLAGAFTRVGSNVVTAFRSPPFASATSFNPAAAAQGSDREDDETYITRLKSYIQSLSRITGLSITTLVNGLQDPVSGLVVGFAQLVDAIAPGISTLFVTDGSSTFANSPQIKSGREVLVGVASTGDKRARLLGTAPYAVSSSPGLQLPYPPIVTQQGTSGATSYTYAIVAKVGVGVSPSARTTTITGNAVLSGVNYNAIAWQAVPGASGGYDVYRTAGGATQGIIASVGPGVLVLNDTGLVGDGSVLPLVNTTVSASTAITPRIFRSSFRGFASSVGINFLEDTTQSFTPAALVGMVMKTDDDQFMIITANTAIRITFATGQTPSLGAYSVFNTGVAPLIPGTDYTFNETVGDMELTVPLVQYDALIAADDNNLSLGAYINSSGLIAYVQKFLNGDPQDSQNFPGTLPHGTKVLVTAPAIVAPNFLIRAVGKTGITDAALKSSVQEIAQRYVNSLGMGGDIVLSRITASAITNIPTLADLQFLSPTVNVPIAEGQLPRISAANVTVV